MHVRLVSIVEGRVFGKDPGGGGKLLMILRIEAVYGKCVGLHGSFQLSLSQDPA